MKPIAVNQAVNYVAAASTEGGKPSVKKGKISEILHQASAGSPGVARIEFSANDQAIASYSDGGEIGSFHFPEETKEVKKSEAFGESPSANGSNGATK